MGWHRAPRLCPIRWWRSPPLRADRPPKAQLLPRLCPPNSARSSSSGSLRGKPLRWFMRMTKKTMRQLKMASSPKERGWRLLHHLLHLLLQHQHHLPRQLHLQHCFLPQFPHRQSKQFPWRRHFLRLRLLSPTSWRTPRAPPRHMYLLEGVLLQPPQLLKLHQAGMKALTTRLSSSPSPPRHHHVKKLQRNSQLKKVVARTSNGLPQCFHKQISPSRSKECGNPSQQNSR